MKIQFILFFITIILFSCNHQAVNSQTKKEIPKEESSTKTSIKNCICVEVWMPVCGKNGKTYSNSCFARCAGISFTQGSCGKNTAD